MDTNIIINILTIAVSAIAGIVTIIGWSKTRTMQEEIVKEQSEIQKSLSEHDTRYAYFHNKRCKILDKLYHNIGSIIGFYDSSISKVRFNSEPLPMDQQEKAISLTHDLSRFYYLNKVYLK